MRPAGGRLFRFAVRKGLAVLAVLAASAQGADPDDDPIFSLAGPPSGFSLPASARDPLVPTPEAFLGHRIGDAMTPPDRAAAYVRALAAVSARLRVEKYGVTAEGRDLLLVAVSSPLNIERLPEIRSRLRAVARGGTEAAARRVATPPVVWVAGSVHGDEPAGMESTLALLYRLAASREPGVEELLSRLVVLVDPCVNPDGAARHAAWWRSAAGPEPDPDPDGVENREPHTGSRLNHGGFDLNRDWAWATQPETRARLAAYLSWMPQVYVDLHEMSSESTYFFPPVGEPTHSSVAPLTRAWLEIFGKAVAAAFDAKGWSYFVREQFDLFYPAYGDSWPSLHGAVGMTFEVSGADGLAYRRRDGRVLTLKERTLKHLTAVWATLLTASSRQEELLRDFAAFFREPRGGRRIFIVPAGQDPGRLAGLASLFRLQGVEVEKTSRDVADLPKPGRKLPAGSLVVDAAQPFGRFVESVLAPETELSAEFVAEERGRFLRDERGRFFDVTAWSLPVAFGLDAFATTDRDRLSSARAPWSPAPPASLAEKATYGWLLPGNDSASRLAAARLLSTGVRVLLVTREARRAGRLVPAGSFLVRRENNGPDVEAEVAKTAAASGVRPIPLGGAWTDRGPSLGSGTVISLKRPTVVVLTGDGLVAQSSAGAVLLALHRDLGLAPLRRLASQVGQMDLSSVTAIVVPAGSDRLGRELAREENAAALKRFVEQGGVVIGIRGGAEALRQKGAGISSVKAWEAPKPEGARDDGKEQGKEQGKSQAKEDEKPPVKARPERGENKLRAAGSAPSRSEESELLLDLERRPLVLPGTALRARTAFPEHPLLFGLGGRVPDFLVMDGRPPKRLPEAAANLVSVAGTSSLSAGFAWKEALDRWSGAPLVQVEELGKGTVVSFAADPVFRGIWLGSGTVFLNAVLLLPPP